MSTVVASRPDVPRHVILGFVQLSVAGGIAWLLLRAEPAPEVFQNASRWGFGLLFGVPCLAFGLRNLHRVMLRCEISVDEHGLSAKVPVSASRLLPWLRVFAWSAAWEDVAPLEFADGPRARLSIGGAGAPLVLEGGEFAASLYEIDEKIRLAAPERVRERVPLSEAVRSYAGTPTRWIALIGLLLVGATFGLSFPFLTSHRDPPTIFGVPMIAGSCLLVLAASGRRQAFVDRRGLFLVHGRHTAFLTADALSGTGKRKLVTEVPGFRVLRVEADGQGGGRIVVKMNKILGLGLPLEDLDADLGRRSMRGFEFPAPPVRRA